MTCNLGGVRSLLFNNAITTTEGQSEIYSFLSVSFSLIPSVNILCGPFSSVMMSIEAVEPGSVTPQLQFWCPFCLWTCLSFCGSGSVHKSLHHHNNLKAVILKEKK